MPIIATAGHVDHGKSTLVQALTGRDPDRWVEEKERGLTIDLGFAWATIEGIDVGFVDVPGHERFIKNMLAGMGAVDVALFVVAADEGWMPQTEEHLSVLDLLDIPHGVIALTRIDLTDEDTADLTELEILEKTEGTALAEWPVVRVAAIAGVGLDELRRSLATQLETAGPSLDRGRPRLWVDRSFHISGAGTVVTGTLAGGTLTLDSELLMWPGGDPVRIRGIQHHEEKVTELAPGTRAALNITGVENAARGMLLGPSVAESTSLLVSLRQVRGLDNDLSPRGAYHVHLGSGSWPVQVRLLGPNLCLIRSRSAIPVQVGDRYILRETGRRAIVGGGRVLDPHPSASSETMRTAAGDLAECLDRGADVIADALLEVRGVATLSDLSRDSGGGRPSTRYITTGRAMAEDAASALLEQALTATARFHTENRLRPGLPKAELASTLGVDVETVVVVLAGSDELIDDGATVRLTTFEPGLTSAEKDSWQEAQRRLGTSLAVPRASQLGLDTELLHALVRDGQLVKVGDDLAYLPDQIELVKQRLRELEGEFTVAEFRDLLGVTRRQAIPLLEWLDRTNVTRRDGDVRVLRI